MDPYTLSKIGNVTIQPVLSKPDTSEDNNKEPPAEPPLQPVQPIPLPKLPPSIDITIKPTNIISELAEIGKPIQNEETEKLPEEDHNSAYSEELKETKSDECEKNAVVDEDISEHTEIETCDKTADKLCEDFPESSEKSPEVDSEVEKDVLDEEIVSENTTDTVQKMEFEGITEGEVMEPADVLEELPSIKDELVDNEEFREDDEQCNDDIPDVPVEELIEDELPEEMLCKEEKFSDEEDESESDDADDELDENQTSCSTTSKKKRKTKSEGDSKDSKKQKTSTPSSDEKSSDSEEKEKNSGEMKVGNLRRNIREVMDETKLDEATLAAQMQEKERLRRVQEQLKANRDIQRQMMQARVLSLIEKGGPHSIKQEEEYDEECDIEEQKPNNVVVLTTGSSKMLDILKKQNSSSASEDEDAPLDKFANLSKNLNKPQMMTASVSIAPVSREPKKPDPTLEKSKVIEDTKQAKGKDVVMISSSSSDEDDCIVISEEESEPEEDTANSGMHTNDLYNVPDDQGRVLINVGHPDSEKDVFLAPQIARVIKPHQIGGVRFLFDNIVESLDRYKTSEGFGCILAHSMGLGKTLQVISFCDVFLRYTEGKTVLCIMPINTLQNWVAEFNMWLPVDAENSSLKEQGEVLARQFPLFVLNDNQKTLSARAKVISQWYKEGGVLLIGYELYRQLSLKKPPKSRTRSKKKIELEEDVCDEKSKGLLEVMYSALVKPGPDLVICDEGHRIKNSHASISQALKQIRSKRRVVLTGYPLQNNLLEYWCMVDFVRPNYLGTKTEFSNMFERPIQNGQCIDSTPQDVKLMRYRAHVLHSLLEGFVQRRSHAVLQQTLPSKYEFVLLLRLTPFQRQLYNTFMNEVVRTKAVPNPLKAFAVCCKIWNHPDILYNFLKKRAGEEDIDLDLEETAPSIGTPASGPSTPMTLLTPPQQTTSKRGRSRSTKGSQGKEGKLPRKNARTSTPQPINKPPSIAAVPPNTANNPKPLPPEQAITTTNNQPIPPFNSYNNSQFSNFSQSGGDNANLNYPNQVPSSEQNFDNQYNNQEYSSQPVSNNAEYGDVNYQQNYNDNNYYQPEYSQNNYWQGSNETSNNFYNSSTSSTEDYYQPSSQSNSSYPGSEYNAQSESSTQGSYNSQNYSFDMNQPMPYHGSSNTGGDFPTKSQQEVDNMRHFNINETNMLDSNMLPTMNNAGNVFNNELNYQHPTGSVGYSGPNSNPGDTMDLGQMTADIKPNITPQFNAAGRGAFQNNPGSNMAQFNSNAPPFAAQQPRVKRPGPGRPPLSQSRARGASSGRASGAGRPRRGAGPRNMAANSTAKFKPGLPGGSPIMKPDGQNFSSVNAPNSHMLAEGDLNASGSNAYANQMNPAFLENIRDEELWNPNTAEQNPLGFADPAYMYETQPQNQSLMPEDAPSLLGGVRATRNLLNEIQNNEIFNPSQTGGFSQNSNDPNVYLENFNYLNDLPITGHTSFMGLLEGDDSIDMHQNNVSAGGQPMNLLPNPGNQPESFIDTNIPYQMTETVDKTAYPEANSNQLEQAPLPAEKDVSQSIQGLARTGQITLNVVDNKKGDAASAKVEKANVAPPNASSSFSTFPKDEQQPQQQHQQQQPPPPPPPPPPQQQQPPQQPQQTRLPSIDVFNTNQNFQGNAANIANRSYGYGEENCVPNTSAQLNQPSWDAFPGAENQQNFNYPGASQIMPNQMNKSQDGNRNPRPTVNVKKELPENEASRVQSTYQNEMKTNEENYNQVAVGCPSASTKPPQEALTKDDLLNRFGSNQNVSLISVNEQKKSNEKRDFYSSAKADVDRGAATPSNRTMSNVPKMERKPQPVRRNPMMGATKSNYPVKSEVIEEGQQYQTKGMPRESTAFSSPAKSVDMCKTDLAAMKELTKDDSDSEMKMPAPDVPPIKGGRDMDPGIPYEWTNEFFKDYEPGKIEASAKTVVFFCMLEEIIRLGDRLLLFSQSLFTLDLIEDFLHLMNIPNTEEKWARNKSYFRLDGSTSALEREKLINEFNSNPSVHLFLVSTRAGSLGINLVGANRVVVFDASWNPCHDTQAVCRVYRYGQQKSCYVYRFVTDNCLEKKIYDRQINKQGMSDRIVDECNPDAHLTIKDVSNLCWDNEDISDTKKDFSQYAEKYTDVVIQKVIREHGSVLSKEPFQHESLLVDRKDKKLSQAEKRQAKQGYEMEKQANLRPSYNMYSNPPGMQNRLGKPMASVPPRIADHPREQIRRWIPAEVWQKEGMSAQEMTLPLDVVIPTGTTDSRSSIVLNAGQKVMVLKSPKGIYMQLENGKIIAIKTAQKTAGIGNGKPLGMTSRNNSMNQGPGGGMGGLKMIPRPPVDPSIAALGHRRDVTVSPIRQRSNMRPNMAGPNVHPHPRSGGPSSLGMPRQRHPSPSTPGRSYQPTARPFPMSRLQQGRPQHPNPQRVPPQLPPSATASSSGSSGSGKQIFGPNSAVTISVANKKRMESQRQQMAQAHARSRGEYMKSADREGTSGLSEVSYDDFGRVPRAKEPASSNMDRRAMASASQFNEFSNAGIDAPVSKTSMSSFGGRFDPAKDGRNAPHDSLPSGVPRKHNLSDILPESLRFKKDINLTPVAKPSPPATGSRQSESDRGKTMTSNISSYQQQQQQQSYAQQPSRVGAAGTLKPAQMASAAMSKNKQPLAKNTSPQVTTETLLAKRDTVQPAVPKPVQQPPLPKPGGAHSISIFPVGKKPEETGSGQTSNFEDTSSYQQLPKGGSGGGNSNFYGSHSNKPHQQQQPQQQPQQYSGYYQDNVGQYYGSGFSGQQQQQSSNYPQQQQQQQAQQQQQQGQFTNSSYSSSEFGGSFGNDNSQYSNQLYGNETAASTGGSSSSQSGSSGASYDEYDSFYNYGQQSKGEKGHPAPQ